MAISEADLPILAELLAPMATPEILGAVVPGAPRVNGIHGDTARTRAWLATLDEGSARALLSKFSSHPIFAAALARLTPVDEPLPVQGPWPWVLAIYPAVNRHEFWKHLKELLDPKGKRILVVWGARQVGKTFTGEFILAELPQRATPVPIRTVYQRVDGAGSVENVVRGVLRKLDLSAAYMPVLDNATKEWWVKETAHWLVDQLHVVPAQQVWLAFDGHIKNEADPYLSMFFAEIVVQASRRFRDSNGCRLILIDYPEGVSGVANKSVTLREEVTLPTETDVTAFLEGMLGAGPETNAKASAIWSKVLQASEIDRMPILANELQALRS